MQHNTEQSISIYTDNSFFKTLQTSWARAHR